MNYIGVVLDIAKSALSLWESKERRKYIDKLAKLEKELYEEEAKPLDKKDMAIIDNLHFDILVLTRAVSSEIRGSNTLNKS